MLEALYHVGASRRIPLCSSVAVFSQQQHSVYLVQQLDNATDEGDDSWVAAANNYSQLDELWSVEAPPATADTMIKVDNQAASLCVSQEVLGVLEASIQPRGWVLVMMALFTVVFVVGIIGNVLVCVAIARYKFVRSVTAVFIASLAISDINVLLICLPVTVIVDVYHTWYWGTTACKTIEFFQQLFVFVTILTLAMLAAERYATICYYSYGRGGRNYRKRRKCRDAVGIVVAVWIISALMALPEVFRVTAIPVFDESPLLASCQSEWPLMSDFALQIFYFLFLFLLPLGVIAFCYYKIVRALSGGGRRLIAECNNQNNQTNNTDSTMPLPPDQSLLAPSAITMFPATRSRSSSAAQRKDTKLSQLQSDYSEPAYNQQQHLLMSHASFSIAAAVQQSATTSNMLNGDANATTADANAKLAEIPSAQLRQRWRLTKMLITIVILFLVSYLPVTIYLLTQPFDLVTKWVSYMSAPADDTTSSSSSSPSNGTSKTNWRLHWDIKTGVALTVHFLVYVNSTVNPVIYYFMSDKFRQAFRKLLLCGILKRWCERRKEALVGSNSQQPPAQNGLQQQQRVTADEPMTNKQQQQQPAKLIAANYNQNNQNAAGANVPIIVVGNNSNSSGQQQTAINNAGAITPTKLASGTTATLSPPSSSPKLREVRLNNGGSGAAVSYNSSSSRAKTETT